MSACHDRRETSLKGILTIFEGEEQERNWNLGAKVVVVAAAAVVPPLVVRLFLRRLLRAFSLAGFDLRLDRSKGLLVVLLFYE